jgi:hypothetical protein
MKELLRTNDAVLLSWAQAVLRDAQIPSWILDGHTSILEGSLGVLPRRLMVADEDQGQAREVLAVAEVPTAP